MAAATLFQPGFLAPIGGEVARAKPETERGVTQKGGPEPAFGDWRSL
jgi:hypothetical protein